MFGAGHAFEDGVLPWRLIYTSPRFRREVADIHESLLYAAQALQERELPLRRTA